MTTTMTTTTMISEPSILTKNTFFFKPACSSSSRKSMEKRHRNTVSAYLTALGFDVTISETGAIVGERGELSVRFHYHESCHNVYKTFSVCKNGRGSNITAIRKLVSSI